jgi:hypothetical protein
MDQIRDGMVSLRIAETADSDIAAAAQSVAQVFLQADYKARAEYGEIMQTCGFFS